MVDGYLLRGPKLNSDNTDWIWRTIGDAQAGFDCRERDL
jgi:hypothetical protein